MFHIEYYMYIVLREEKRYFYDFTGFIVISIIQIMFIQLFI